MRACVGSTRRGGETNSPARGQLRTSEGSSHGPYPFGVTFLTEDIDRLGRRSTACVGFRAQRPPKSRRYRSPKSANPGSSPGCPAVEPTSVGGKACTRVFRRSPCQPPRRPLLALSANRGVQGLRTIANRSQRQPTPVKRGPSSAPVGRSTAAVSYETLRRPVDPQSEPPILTRKAGRPLLRSRSGLARLLVRGGTRRGRFRGTPDAPRADSARLGVDGSALEP